METKNNSTPCPVQSKSRLAVLAVFDILKDIVPAAIITFILIGVVFRLAFVVGDSMSPTLENGSIIAIRHIGYTPQRGDIVVCSPSGYGANIVKRVIAISGDSVDIDAMTGDVIVNGEVIVEPYIKFQTTRLDDVTFPLTVDDGYIFVMGDNRNLSIDSRSSAIGQIDVNEVIGGYIFTIMK